MILLTAETLGRKLNYTDSLCRKRILADSFIPREKPKKRRQKAPLGLALLLVDLKVYVARRQSLALVSITLSEASENTEKNRDIIQVRDRARFVRLYGEIIPEHRGLSTVQAHKPCSISLVT